MIIDNDLAEEWFEYKRDGAEEVYFGCLEHDNVYSLAYNGDGMVIVAFDCFNITEEDIMLHIFNELDHVESEDPDPKEMWEYGIHVEPIGADSFWQLRQEFMLSNNSHARFYVSYSHAHFPISAIHATPYHTCKLFDPLLFACRAPTSREHACYMNKTPTCGATHIKAKQASYTMIGFS